MASPAVRGGTRSEFARFVVAGLVNTCVTLFIFELLRRVMPYLGAYSLTYAIGIALSYLLNAGFVFKVEKSAKSAATFPLVYVAQYLVGTLLMWALVARFSMHPTLALLVTVAVSMPLTFGMTRFVLRHPRFAASRLPSQQPQMKRPE